MKPIRFDVTDADGVLKGIVRGVLSEITPEEGWVTLAHPYPDFDVEAGWIAKGGSVVLTLNSPRDGQRIPCSRG